MELYGEILQKTLAGQEVRVSFPGLTVTPEDILHSVCYRALVEIRDIIRDESYTDPECFYQIEGVIRVLERLGSGGGFRHDYG